jgi:glycine cleavage system H lipoate-binding protein
VWIGKYPKALCGNIYTISAQKPVNDAELGFINWIMTGGQQFLSPFGYQNLVYSERQSQLESLTPTANNAIETPKEVYNIPRTALIIVVCFVAFLFGMDLLSRYLTVKKVKPINKSISGQNAFNENSVKVPKGLYYDKTHTWSYMDADGMVKIGIDDFFQHVTGSLTNIKMKSPGEKIKKGELLISVIQKGKQLNIYAPVTGTIISCNDLLSSNTSLINTSPYKDGWVYMLEPVNWLRDVQFLIMADTYRQWLIKEFSRLKDFLAVNLKVHKLEYSQVILQDGGELKDGVLEDLGPEIWEDFQVKFINAFK